jgi:hypothetical protein
MCLLTLIAEIVLRFVIGALVKERREGGRVVLIPVGGTTPRPEPRPQPPRDPLGFPPAYADTLPHPHTEKNTARPSDTAPIIELPRLKPPTYFLYQIQTLKVINADQRGKKADPPLSAYQPGAGGCEVIANGSFTTKVPGKGDQLFPVVTVMRKGVLENNGQPKTWGRGGVAVLRDGTITIDRQEGVEAGSPQNQVGLGLKSRINEVFGERGNPVSDFMGGGALLIENGMKVSSDDLYNRQVFDNGGQGLFAEQFRQANVEATRLGEQARRRSHVALIRQELKALRGTGRAQAYSSALAPAHRRPAFFAAALRARWPEGQRP